MSRESDQIKDSSSLLELPPDIGDDEGEIQLSPGSPADSAELSHSYRDDREIIIPGRSGHLQFAATALKSFRGLDKVSG